MDHFKTLFKNEISVTNEYLTSYKIFKFPLISYKEK